MLMELCSRFPELDDVFYAMVVYDREQYFEKYEDCRSLGVSVVVIGIIMVGLRVQQVIAPSPVANSSVLIRSLFHRSCNHRT